MPHAERISLRQASMLLVTALTSTGHLLFVRIVAHYAGHDAWISLVLAILAYSLCFLAILSLVARLPGKNLIEICIALLGPIAGRVLATVFILYFIHMGALLMRNFGDFVHLILPQTPLTVVVGVMVTLVVYSSRKGIEPVARANDLALPLLVVVGATASMMLAKEKHFAELLPVLQQGWAPVFQGGLAFLGLFAEALVFVMFSPCLGSAKKPQYRALWGILAVGVLFIGPITGAMAVFGSQPVRRMIYPTFEEMKRIEIADFLANLDVLSLLLWTIGSFIKASVFLWAAATAIGSLVKLRDYRPVIPPLGVIIWALAFLLAGSGVDVQHFLNQTYPIYGIMMGILLPLLLLVLAWIRHPRR